MAFSTVLGKNPWDLSVKIIHLFSVCRKLAIMWSKYTLVHLLRLIYIN